MGVNSPISGDEPHVVELDLFQDERGSLGVVEAARHAGFPFQRFYFLSDVPHAAQRGGHAHKRLRQCLVCLRGGVTVDLEKGGRRWRFRLDGPGQGLVLPPGIWRDLHDFTDDALVGVLASEAYDEEDYIRDHDAFLVWSNGQDTLDQVPFADLSRAYSDQAGEIDQAIREVLRSGWYIGGQVVESFEESFAGYCDATGAVGVANGLQALVLALRAAGVGPGDEVVLPANTFVATALAVREAGATPVLADIDIDTGSVDVAAVAEAITPRTRALIPVHLYGHPADMDPLRDMARTNGVFLLEDAAQAHGARYKGRRCGSLGDAAAFSFYPTKNLGAVGDAGAVTASDPALLDKVRMLGNYGASEKYHHILQGTNSRLDAIQAAVLKVKLPRLDFWNERRRALARQYMDGLSRVDGVSLPVVREWAEPVWHVFPVRVPAARRDALRTALNQAGIGTNIHYPVPVSGQECFADMGWRRGQFPAAERAASELLSLPLDPFHTESEVVRVIERVRAFFAMS